MTNAQFPIHIPVLQKEVLQYLNPQPNESFIDCTIGEAGHSLAILERNGPKGKVLGIDQSPEIIKNLESRIWNPEFKKRLILVCDNFVNLKEIIKKACLPAGREKFKLISGILFDLGISNWHLKESGRGFSFLKNEPLDMRYNPQNPLNAEKIINYWSGSEIEKILGEFGEERFVKNITKGIIGERKLRSIKTTLRLVEIIKRAVPPKYQGQRLHLATRTFQALRIAVNDELNNLKKALPQALEILNPGGRLVVISFHSLEDRIVKNFCREQASVGLKILTKKPVGPTIKEIKINPRSRSSKLRAVIKI